MNATAAPLASRSRRFAARAATTWTVRSRPHQRPALFVAHAVASEHAVVIAAAGGVADLGAIGLIALFVPGAARAQIVLMPAEQPS